MRFQAMVHFTVQRLTHIIQSIHRRIYCFNFHNKNKKKSISHYSNEWLENNNDYKKICKQLKDLIDGFDIEKTKWLIECDVGYKYSFIGTEIEICMRQ